MRGNRLGPLLLVILWCSGVEAWSAKEHILLTRLAAERLIGNPATPEAMKRWLIAALRPGARDMAAERDFLLFAHTGTSPRGADGLAYWSVMPDVVAAMDKQERILEPFGVSEQKL